MVQRPAQQSGREEKEAEIVNPARLLRQHLQSLSAAGLSHLPRAELPASALVTALELPAAQADVAAAAPARAQSSGAGAISSKLSTKAVMAPAKTALAILADKVKACTRCSELAETRTQTVFGVGNPQARILFIGEAPGADEDAQGEPFVGKAGQLLNQIIDASRLKREELYICNILKCRPPGNRTPLETECANCREFLLGQLSAIDPEYIVCWGAVAAQNLLSTTVTIGKLRGRFLQFGRAKVLCTYHPSYLLRNPAAKKDVWKDMQFLMADMGVDLTAKP
jgi:DNA polymerase